MDYPFFEQAIVFIGFFCMIAFNITGANRKIILSLQGLRIKRDDFSNLSGRTKKLILIVLALD